MGLLRKLFGKDKEEIWKGLSDELGGKFQEGGLWSPDRVEIKTGEWIVTLDTCEQEVGEKKVIFTRMRAPYVNKDGFRFNIYRAGLLTGLGKFMGLQDVEVGDVFFDEEFVIQGNNEAQLKKFFANQSIRTLIREQPRINLCVKEDEGYFHHSFPEGVDELHFISEGVITNINRLKKLYELFAEGLHHLCAIGSAYEDDPDFKL